MLLRDVEYGDVDTSVRMRCNPAVMAVPGGPLPREGTEAKVHRDVQRASAGTDWTKMIVPDAAEPDVVAGTVTLWTHDAHGERISEIGWMVLPEFQGRELGKQDVRTLPEPARDDSRWGRHTRIPQQTTPRPTASAAASVPAPGHPKRGLRQASPATQSLGH
ncbi:GNAT family N-acetyltransferase [Streptomyces sp. NPDC059456]|uniref:GNAT family N-acetyltransferase n=1 Tax=Streptomyces sp. NPDC059456 TaxID=3346838 RepID=UPI0036AA5045